MKKLLLALIFLWFSSAVASDVNFIGSIKSNKYHYSTCSAAQRIKKENRTYFITPEEAIDRGYVPCGICKPPKTSTEKQLANLEARYGKVG